MFLSDPFDVGVEGASVADCTGFVRSLIDVANSDGGGELFSGDSEFSCCSELGNKQGVQEKSFAIAIEDSVDLLIV